MNNQTIVFIEEERLIKYAVQAARIVLEEYQSKSGQKSNPEEELLTVSQAANFLDLSKSTIYTKISQKELPVIKRGKRVYFIKARLMEYLKAGEILTKEQMMAEAHTYLKRGR